MQDITTIHYTMQDITTLFVSVKGNSKAAWYIKEQTFGRYAFVFMRGRKVEKRDCWLHHVCPTVRLSARNNSNPTGWIFMKFGS
jgi:hypothetical protein